MTNRGALEVLRTVLERPALVDVLREDTFDRRDIEHTLDVSRSTAHRVVHELRDNQIVSRSDDGYEITPLGGLVVEEAEQSRSVVDTALTVQPLLDVAESNGHALPIEAMSNAEIGNTERDVQEIEERLIDLVSTAESIRCASKTVVSHRFLAAIFDRMDGSAAIDIVSTEDVIEFVRTTHPAMPEISEVPQTVDVSIAESIPFFITIADGRAYVGTYNLEALQINFLLETENATAVAWAEDCFAEIKADSNPAPCKEINNRQQ